MKVTISFTLDDKVDHDLLRWLESFNRRNRSRAIRDGLRDHLTSLSRERVTLHDLCDTIRDMQAAVADLRRTGVRLASLPTDEPDDDIPDDIAVSLSRLGL